MQTPDLATRLFLGFPEQRMGSGGHSSWLPCHVPPLFLACAALLRLAVVLHGRVFAELVGDGLLARAVLRGACICAMHDRSTRTFFAVCEAAHRRGSGRPLVARTHAAVLMSTTPIGFRLGSTADRRHSCTRLMHSFGPAVRVPIARAVVSIIAVLCVASLANQARCGPQLREAQESSLHRYQVQAVPLRTPTAHVSLCAQRTRLQNRYR